MDKPLLIANRGEIACRIIKTARRMGIKTVAVYSEADSSARHVRLADSALCIGAAESKASYLNIQAILQAAKIAGAGWVHPGYGFLSENAEFAEQAKAEGLIFVGPSPAAIRAMGEKNTAKSLMRDAGVPLIPGIDNITTVDDDILQHVADIGYPLMLKAVAGGGGKGIRLVEKAEDLAEALESVKREAMRAFADDRIMVEAFIQQPRHVEVQILADHHGNVLTLWERDCSVQRRHQKLWEEAPAPELSAQQRQEMSEAAVLAAKAVLYTGAGTVEFLLGPDGRFFFLEMNTRLQVEHPVTEMITGLDLVEWQLRIARGESLPAQSSVQLNGHAIEVRITAEDADRGFLPASGTLQELLIPAEQPWLRVDHGLIEGQEVNLTYDPLLAKLIVWGQDRAQAIRHLQEALNQFFIAGVATNLGFLRRLAYHPHIGSGAVDTGFLAANPNLTTADGVGITSKALAALAYIYRLAAAGGSISWQGFWANMQQKIYCFAEGLVLTAEEDSPALGVAPAFWQATSPDGEILLYIWRVRAENNVVTLEYSENSEHAPKKLMRVLTVQGLHVLQGEGVSLALPWHGLDSYDHHQQAQGSLEAPMPGMVVALLADVGSTVEIGTPLLVLEAMKMEHRINSPVAGTLQRFFFQQGEQVKEGMVLAEIL
ncbi:MAG: acetyl/propionyl/methylcrotonyl-CoA carboxylase subunit alpha [Alphaproteobacteria bacterium]